MAKNIVLCSDGTGNTPGKGRGTNVHKIYLAIDRYGYEIDPTQHPDKKKIPRQIAFYDDGVGTEGIRIFRLLGGAFGLGLARNVRQLYTDLVLNYEPGDDIYLFGFSRGAFTVRALAAMICECGLLKKKVYLDENSSGKHNKRLRKIHRTYRSIHDEDRKKLKDTDDMLDVEIQFVGVWDTVDAVGSPILCVKNLIDWLWRKIFRLHAWRFRNNRLHKNVLHGCQALAIDDERLTFHPRVWEPADRIEQVWFAGVHSNVGGGYPKEGLADVALYWMMLRAESKGLKFLDDARTLAHNQANVHGKLYDSRLGLASYYRYCPRNIRRLCNNSEVKVHVTALDRIALATDGYAPLNLPDTFKVVDPDAENKAYVKTRVEKQQQCVAGSAGDRNSRQSRVQRLQSLRAALYYTFLSYTGAIAVILAVLFVNDCWPVRPLDSVSAFLSPLLGFLNPVTRWILDSLGFLLSITIGIALPDFLKCPIRMLKNMPEVVTLFILLGILLFILRGKLIRKMREQGDSIWRNVFNS